MVKVWKPLNTVVFNEEGENLYLIEFQNEQDMCRVWESRPWLFHRNLVILHNLMD